MASGGWTTPTWKSTSLKSTSTPPSCAAPTTPAAAYWERWELEKAMELYKKYNVYVVSDEIWSDIILSGHKHIPTQSISEDARMRTAALYAPSKTFNLAGLIGSYHIVYNPWWRDRIKKESSSAIITP